MKLILKNIGKVKDASVEINGITVIAGENNTGKSTVGRALFSVFNSFCNIEKQIRNERINSVERLLDKILFDVDINGKGIHDVKEIAKIIVNNLDTYKNIPSIDMKKNIMDILFKYGDKNNFDNADIDETISRITDVLNVSNLKFLEHVLEKKLNNEFSNQICNIFSNEDGEIELQIKNTSIITKIKNEGGVEIINKNNVSLHTEVVYIDDPFVLDNDGILYRILPNLSVNHRNCLLKKIMSQKNNANVFDEIVAKDKLNSIYKKISSVCSGDISFDNRFQLEYKRKDSDKVLNVRNLSTGLKTFVILKQLLLNGTIEQNGVLVLDEPEIHLHPEWQLLFAELIVLIQKQFDIHVLLNTHSPYFLRAIQVYSSKYESANACKYYLSENFDDQAIIKDVTNDIDKIYSKLYRPLQKLEDERW